MGDASETPTALSDAFEVRPSEQHVVDHRRGRLCQGDALGVAATDPTPAAHTHAMAMLDDPQDLLFPEGHPLTALDGVRLADAAGERFAVSALAVASP